MIFSHAMPLVDFQLENLAIPCHHVQFHVIMQNLAITSSLVENVANAIRLVEIEPCLIFRMYYISERMEYMN